MPKIGASMADISTTYVLPEPGSHTFKIEKIVEGVLEGGRKSLTITCRIQDAGDDHNKPVTIFVSLHKKDGSINEYGLASVKRLFEAIAPESANDDDADTDELLNGLFLAEVYHDTYESKTRKDPETGEPAKEKSAKINERTISPAA